MQQIALDIGLSRSPDLAHYFAGPNEAATLQLRAWLAHAGLNPVPLYLWGAPSSGKTYLLHAARQALLARGLQCGWMDAHSAPETFNEQWSAIFLDAVDLYSPEQQQQAFAWLTQAQALHTKSLAAGSDAPATLSHLREDLRNRLAWGHVHPLEVLNEAQRRAVLRQEADARGIVLGDEVLDFMLRHFSRDLSSLMQLLEKIDGYALYAKRAVTVPLIKAMLEQSE